MMKIIPFVKEYLGSARATYEHSLELGLCHECIVCQIAHLLEEFVGCNLDEPLEAPLGLAPSSVLAGNQGLDVLDGVDPLALQKTQCGLAPIDHNQSVDVSFGQHVLQRLQVKR